MKRLLLLPVFVWVALCSAGQLRNAPSTTDLAEAINKRYPDSLSKIRAAYTWVTTQMHYSDKNILAMNHGPDPRSIIDVSFQNRAGVCENFAAIFTDLCRKMGFRAAMVSGYTTHSSAEERAGHSWSAVNIGNVWYLFDPTWDIGKSSGFRFFRSTGYEFIETHVPFDPIWQLLVYPFIPGKKYRSVFMDYRDSINKYFVADSTTLLENSINRITQNKNRNMITEMQLKVLRNQLEIKYQEDQMLWYDSALNCMNEATRLLNRFIDLRNDEFSGVANLQALPHLLSGIGENLQMVAPLLDKVDNSPARLVYGTWPAREQLEKIEKKYARQQQFLEEYIASKNNG